jgi:exonuclease III
MNATKIASINMNALTAQIRIDMLFDFLRRQDIDIALLQEVSDAKVFENRGYEVHPNIGAEMRGTAFLTRPTCSLSNI